MSAYTSFISDVHKSDRVEIKISFASPDICTCQD